MVGEEQQIIRLRNDFYRDGYRKVLFSLGLIIAAVLLMIATSVYLYTAKPPPVSFTTDNEWRVLPPVPITEAYLSDADVKQWVSNVLQAVFDYDFVNYHLELQMYRPYFTENGWKVFTDFLNNYAAPKTVVNAKLFVHGFALEAPEIRSKGLEPEGKRFYAWLVRMKMKVIYASAVRNYPSQEPELQVLVVRVPTLNNISGVAIDNIMLATSTTSRRSE